MKIDVTQTLKDYRGKPIKERKIAIQLRNVISLAVNFSDQKHILTAEQKNKAFQISVKVWGKNKRPNLTVDDLAFIKERVGLVYSPLIYGRVCEIFDGKADEEDKLRGE